MLRFLIAMAVTLGMSASAEPIWTLNWVEKPYLDNTPAEVHDIGASPYGGINPFLGTKGSSGLLDFGYGEQNVFLGPGTSARELREALNVLGSPLTGGELYNTDGNMFVPRGAEPVQTKSEMDPYFSAVDAFLEGRVERDPFALDHY